MRLTRASRLARVGAAPLVPFVMLGRTAATVFRHGAHRIRFLAMAPFVFTGFCTWAYGEAREYLASGGSAVAQAPPAD